MSQRDGFTSTFGVLVATLGSAVGLGNIWKFPYLTGTNGGAGFLLVYLLATLLVGLPVMIAEIMLGRTARANAVSTFAQLAPRQPFWQSIGYMGLVAAVLILAFYTEVAGWVFSYIVKALAGQLQFSDPHSAAGTFQSLVSSPMQALLWQWLVLAFTGGIIMLGVSKGIEAVTKRLMPLLFLLLVLLCIRSLTLPGAMGGLTFLLKPDFSKITTGVVLTAMGLAFFKLSIGMGTMITYGSYFRAEQNIPATALRVMLADLSVSLLAGLAIFPAVFAFGFAPSAGPSLVFMTIPAVFHSMPGGSIFMALFFLLTAIAATGAILSILEVPVAMLTERLGWSRRKATILSIVTIAVLGVPAALSQSSTADWKLFGLNAFDLFDFISSNILLPLGGILIAVYVGWVYGLPRLQAALGNDGQLQNSGVIRLVHVLARYVAPLLITVILLKGLGVF
ncbi:neurotransmitter:Na+ symporter, NSS family [Andreprevotia lacus DSM 23236]|jgi:NSS family neurotransmitter:Na+ symporter|uniref:Transporter n=1 Tax=Andreprevotia lacus DSM 23236 TaxID=1121001 RepID=A0A1W1XHJ0_9NEIS|nr:sodium-dependent transporter [Andreprevotia lacus]SMC23476.1 neurotransmitter:Na+ symporter, NSS family [Andreprevotia lacus DSM 23236]